jgi:hypothetical protein
MRMTELSRVELSDRITLECPQECISTCGITEYASSAADFVEERANERLKDPIQAEALLSEIVVSCSGPKKRFRFLGAKVCPQLLKVDVVADDDFSLDIDFSYYNKHLSRPDLEP